MSDTSRHGSIQVPRHAAHDDTMMRIALPGHRPPLAVMSLADAGDMGFGDDGNRHRRADWLKEIGFDPERAASADLVHSRTVAEALRPGDLRGVEADGIVTPGIGSGAPSCLVITVADCMPIFLYDSDSGAYGLLHSGWQGTGILAEAVSIMRRQYGTNPKNLSAAFGPRIGTCCYVVDEARASVFAGEFGSSAVSRPDGRPRLDLVEANMSIADKLGIGSVVVAEGCTCCDTRFGSFRRQGAGRFTRMAAAIGWPEAS